jgi:hypothetical protein
MDVKVDLNVAWGLYSYPQYIYQDSKLLAPVVNFAEPDNASLWVIWEEQTCPITNI